MSVPVPYFALMVALDVLGWFALWAAIAWAVGTRLRKMSP